MFNLHLAGPGISRARPERRRSGTGVVSGLVLAAMLVSLSGCASFRGSAEPVVPLARRLKETDRLHEVNALLHYYSSDAHTRGGLDQRSYRNYVADIYMSAADARYDEFKASLSRQSRGSNFGSAATVLLLNGLAVVSGVQGARALAMGSAVVTGTNSALSKDVFYDKTLQALLAAMDGNRSTVKIRIRDGLKRSPEEYSLQNAFDDIRDLEAQASLDRALQQITTLATTDAATKKAKLQTLYKAPILTAQEVEPLVAFKVQITGLQKSGKAEDLAALKAMAAAAGTTTDAPPRKIRSDLLDWLNKPEQEADLDETIARLNDAATATKPVATAPAAPGNP